MRWFNSFLALGDGFVAPWTVHTLRNGYHLYHVRAILCKDLWVQMGRTRRRGLWIIAILLARA